MYKTITELSKELGVSRQAVHQAVNKILDKDSIKKKGNAFILNNKQQAEIKKHFKTDSRESSSNESSDMSRTLQILTAELEVKNKQIEQLHKQINELHILLLREKDTKQLTESNKIVDNDKLDPEPETPRKWYQIFKRT